MSVSTHLTPEPERRLWIILEQMRQGGEQADWKLFALAAFAAGQLAFVRSLGDAGPSGLLALASLCAALPLGVFAFSPMAGTPRWLPLLDPSRGRPGAGDRLIAADDVVKYSQTELVNRFDKYLGGGITATPYYEDIVAGILVAARIAARKRRLLRAACLLVGVAQLGLLGLLF